MTGGTDMNKKFKVGLIRVLSASVTWKTDYGIFP